MDITANYLLDRFPMLSTRPYQIEALLNIYKHNKCLIHMFCGTGKSLIMFLETIIQHKDLSVFVFPSLELIRQFYQDYILNDIFKNLLYDCDYINISTEKLDNINSTTYSNTIKLFLQKTGKKIVFVTYQSFSTFLNCIDDYKIGIINYDEAHHVCAEKTHKLVFNKSYYELQRFYTATPKNNSDVIMYDYENPENSMCGPVAFKMSYTDGVTVGVLNKMEIRGITYTGEDTNINLYECIARSILETGNSRALLYHKGVVTGRNKNVTDFVNEKLFTKIFNNLIKSDFPEKTGFYRKILFNGMDGKTPPNIREQYLTDLKLCPINEVCIISSCETLSEGIDTKTANLIVFVDSKGSYTKIIQNIGRGLRRNNEQDTTIILVLLKINIEKYDGCNKDPILCDKHIREQMVNDDGDFTPIMNVLSALFEDDPNIHDQLVNYPKYKKDSLEKQGYKSIEPSDSTDSAIKSSYTAEEVKALQTDSERPIEIHRTDETPIEYFNEEKDGDILRLIHNDETDTYTPLISIDKEELPENKRKKLDNPPKPPAKLTFKHNNPEVEALWSIDGELDFTKKICSMVLKCQVRKKVENLQIFLDYLSKNILENNSISPKDYHILNTHKMYFNNGTRHMSIPKCRELFEDFKKKHPTFVCAQQKKLLETITNYLNYKKNNNGIIKSPNKHSGDTIERKLGENLSAINGRYKNKELSMKIPECREMWKKFLKDNPEFKPNDSMYDNLKKNIKQIVNFVDINKKNPNNKHPTNEDEKKLGRSLGRYKRNYKKKSQSMKDPKCIKIWEYYRNDSRYFKYFRMIDEPDPDIVFIRPKKT